METECRCGRFHRLYSRAANCRWPWAWSVDGEGAYAVLAHCGDYYGKGGLTVTLWATRDEAEKVLDNLRICGGQCVGNHEIVDMEGTVVWRT